MNNQVKFKIIWADNPDKLNNILNKFPGNIISVSSPGVGFGDGKVIGVTITYI